MGNIATMSEIWRALHAKSHPIGARVGRELPKLNFTTFRDINVPQGRIPYGILSGIPRVCILVV